MDDPLLGGGTSSSSSGRKNFHVESAMDTGKAPIELMSQFLLCIADRNMVEAGKLCDEILEFEPNNKMVLEYRDSIKEYISQGLDVESEDDGKEDDGKEDESNSDSNSDSKGSNSDSESDHDDGAKGSDMKDKGGGGGRGGGSDDAKEEGKSSYDAKDSKDYKK